MIAKRGKRSGSGGKQPIASVPAPYIYSLPPDSRIPKSAAVQFVAEHIRRPDGTLRAAKDRVSQRIRYAVGKDLGHPTEAGFVVRED